MKIFVIKHTIFNLFLLGLLLMVMASNGVSAQKLDTTGLSAPRLKELAGKFYRNGEIYSAIFYYGAYIKKEPADIKMTCRLAGLYFEVRNYEMANRLYDTVIRKEPDKFKLAYFNQGVVLTNLGEYEAATEKFTKFRKIYRKNRDIHSYRKRATGYIESAQWAISHADSVADITVSHVEGDVNKEHIEFSPFPLNDTKMIYGSLLPEKNENINVPEKRQLYNAEKRNDKWYKTGPVEGGINHPWFNTGNAVVSADGLRMYFTRCRKNWQNREICELFKSEKKDGKWQEPEKLPYPVNNENNTSTQPALGINSKKGNDILFFVSDRDGTKGGTDLWMTEFNKRTNQYREPRNLGTSINTPGNECCPFFDNTTGTLYFSSDGRNGFGGYDVYKSNGSARLWTKAAPMPAPINTSYDETYFSVIPNKAEGFFTSNRPGSFSLRDGNCCDDIFYYKYNKCVRIETQGTVYNFTNYDVYDLLNEKYALGLEYPEDNSVLPDIPVNLYAVDKNTGDEVFVNRVRTDENGMYSFNLERDKEYIVLIRNYGYFDKRIRISPRGYDCSDTIILTETKINYLPEITIRFNVYYEHDKSRLTPQARNTIDSMFMTVFDLFPDATIEIGSHTDNTGTDNYNIKLSQRRSESVVDYLVKKGISANRLVAKGYGESVPIAPNTNEDGTDNPEGRRLNRRTELKVVGDTGAFYEDAE